VKDDTDALQQGWRQLLRNQQYEEACSSYALPHHIPTAQPLLRQFDTAWELARENDDLHDDLLYRMQQWNCSTIHGDGRCDFSGAGGGSQNQSQHHQYPDRRADQRTVSESTTVQAKRFVARTASVAGQVDYAAHSETSHRASQEVGATSSIVRSKAACCKFIVCLTDAGSSPEERPQSLLFR
jgi:hypothetical protein